MEYLCVEALYFYLNMKHSSGARFWNNLESILFVILKKMGKRTLIIWFLHLKHLNFSGMGQLILTNLPVSQHTRLLWLLTKKINALRVVA